MFKMSPGALGDRALVAAASGFGDRAEFAGYKAANNIRMAVLELAEAVAGGCAEKLLISFFISSFLPSASHSAGFGVRHRGGCGVEEFGTYPSGQTRKGNSGAAPDF